ncbi:MAG: tRNA(fMet)-specific endonuclease VapC [Chloroflexia bacterium]|jgi:tRNA(fMet)-specific endonuclease VapC|nr:tRNA(fMet)-specific endonuclease VapC [Chloroflexia bacterium]
MKYMLDTNVCVEMIRRKPPGLLRRIMQQPISEVGISSISVAELQFGVRRSKRPAQNQQALEQFLIPLVILDFDPAAAMAYGLVRAHLEAQGTPIGSLDTLIAAHALSHDLTLVTNNTREFARVPGLAVEDWSAS